MAGGYDQKNCSERQVIGYKDSAGRIHETCEAAIEEDRIRALEQIIWPLYKHSVYVPVHLIVEKLLERKEEVQEILKNA